MNGDEQRFLGKNRQHLGHYSNLRLSLFISGLLDTFLQARRAGILLQLRRDGVAALPRNNRLAGGGRRDLHRTGHRERLHELFDILFVFGFNDQYEGVLAIQHGIAEDIHAEPAGVFPIHMLDEHLAHFGIFCRAGLCRVLVTNEIE